MNEIMLENAGYNREQSLADYIDLTNLKIEATSKDIRNLCRLAKQYKVKGVCVQPNCIEILKKQLRNTDILKIVVPNWIMGGGILPGREYLLDYSKEADEIDYIVNIYQTYESKEYDKVEEEIRKVKQYAKILKVIIESSYVRYTHYEERVQLTKKIIEIIEKAGADFIKTDSGLFKRMDKKVKLGESVSIIETAEEGLIDDVKTIMKNTKLKVKVAGGIKTKELVNKLIELGVSRIGTSSLEVLK